jgi:hypothetical protein
MWKVAARLRLGKGPFDTDEPHQCSGCQSKIARSELVNHIMTCKHVEGLTKVHRHNRVMNTFRRTLNSHMITTSMAVCGYNDAMDKQGKEVRTSKVPDFVIHCQGQPICTDVTIGMPTALSHVERASVSDMATAIVLEKNKKTKHASAATSNGHKFAPLALEVFGRWGPSATLLAGTMSAMYGKQVGWELRERVSLELQKANAEMIIAYMSCRPRGGETSKTFVMAKLAKWQVNMALGHNKAFNPKSRYDDDNEDEVNDAARGGD